MHEHLHGQHKKVTILQNFSLVLLFKEQFVPFQIQYEDVDMADGVFNKAETLATFCVE